MVQEIKRILGKIPGEYKEGVEAVDSLVDSLGESGLLPDSLSKQEASGQQEVDTLQQAAQEYNKGVKTPEAVTKFWKIFWEVNGQKAGVEITVPAFPDSSQSLHERLSKGDMPIYVPREVSTQNNRHLLGRIWPQMGNYSVQEGNPITEEVDHSGWRYVETSIKAPHLNSNEEQLRKAIKEKRDREGMTVSEYIIASQFSHRLTGKYLDHGYVTWSRLLGSRGEGGGGVVSADFDSDGYLYVYWVLDSQSRFPRLGGRSSLGVQKA